jgi:hypothetical protein
VTGPLLGCMEFTEPDQARPGKVKVRPVKKLLLLALVGLGVFAVWRKVQADRAELDLWTEATTGDE